MSNATLTAVAGLKVGHWTHAEAATGCTVILCPAEGCVASSLVLGGAPATRETALLEPEKMMPRINALLLSGGSAFGLAAASGVVRYLEERGVGFATRAGPVPIVPAACIYDLEVGKASRRPDEAAGYAAAQAASDVSVATGRVGVGSGATASAYLGYDRAARSGLGSLAVSASGATLAALAVSNPAGDIYDPRTGELVAGHGLAAAEIARALRGYRPAHNTTLVVVATDASLSKAEARALAVSAHVGIAQVTRPSHTVYDGDTAFVLSTGRGPELSLGALSVLVQELVAETVLQGVRAAQAA